MRLKQLRLSGFKSFCDDTTLTFTENGISVIVGPNGCGKSNVVDAIRWALGEQSPRFLRGGAMTDVIFNGSASRKPVGRAEVTLIFDNSQGLSIEKFQQYAEISVTRRIYRSGESDYLINNTPCRLLDIRELVMDTGAAGRSYSIVEQGKVDQFVTNTPTERRIFLEEAAGIVRYKTKRIAAEKRMDQTRQNLLRVHDVLGEVIQREETLRDQVQKARDYLALRDEVASLGTQLNRARYMKSSAKFREITARQQEDQTHLDNITLEYQTRMARQENKEAELTVMEHLLRDMREEVHGQEKAIGAQETDLALRRQEKQNHEEWMSRLEANKEDYQKQHTRLEQDISHQREEVHRLEAQETTLRQSIATDEQIYQERETIRLAIEAEARATQERLLECHTQSSGVSNQIIFLNEKIVESDRRGVVLEEQTAATGQELQGAVSQLEAKRAFHAGQIKALEEIKNKAETLDDLLAEKSSRLESAREELRATEKRLLDTHTRLDALKEIHAGYEGFAEGVRSFLQWADSQPERRKNLGLIGPLVDFITISPQVLEWAGGFLAPYLELIVVRQTAQAAQLEQILGAEGFGRVRVVALDMTSSPAGGSGSPPSGEETLAGWVSLPPDMEPLRARLFGNIRLLPPDTTPHPLPEMVTKSLGNGGGLEWLAPDGRFHIDPKAVYSLGKAQPASVAVLKRRQEIEALEEKLIEAQGAAARQRESLESLEAETGLMTAQRQSLEEERQQKNLETRGLEQEFSHGERETARLNQILNSLKTEQGQLKSDRENALEQKTRLENALREWSAKRISLEAELEEIHKKEALSREESSQLGQRLTEAKVDHQRVLSTLQNGQTRLNTLAVEAAQLVDRAAGSDEAITAEAKKVAKAVLEIERLLESLAQANTNLAKIRQTLVERAADFAEQEGIKSRMNEENRVFRTKVEEAQTKLAKLEVALTEERMRLEQIREMLGEDIPPDEQEPSIDEADVEARWAKGRKALEKMEGVNLAAPEEYDALKERIGFLSQQKEDLEKACKDLEESIRHMNTESRKRFKETFDKVNEKFQEVFPRVFEGGSARLVLTESEDLLLAGVDIEAEPPGKKLSSLNLLSGGEKALTAIALIFSFFLIKPSPFCLLDEVDAPLDDANVGRFNRLVQSITDRSQFIIITHNRRTMEIGNLLYGITMEENGVSKVVSVNLSDHG